MLELDGATLTYEVFREKCLRTNRPAIVRNTGGAASPPLSFDLPALMEQLSPNGLCALLGPQHAVPVYHVHSIHPTRATTFAEGESGEYECEEKPLGEVLQSWRASAAKDDAHGESASNSTAPERIYYLKDWHMQSEVEAAFSARQKEKEGLHDGAREIAEPRVFCEDRNAFARHHANGLYHSPPYLGPDWIDPFSVEVIQGAEGAVGFGDGKHDYRFAYIGAVNTWTVLHHDVFGTYSWSFNVCGDKLWFFPDLAGNQYLLDNLVKGFPTPPDMRVLTGFQYWTCVQHPGDLVFVPSRYYHQVHNISGHTFSYVPSGSEDAITVDLTMAVNHNWCNQFCISRMTDTFLDDADTLLGMLDVNDLRLILGDSGVEAWRSHVDFMLQGGSNWSFRSFSSFLRFCIRVFGQDDGGEVRELLESLLGKVEKKWSTMFSS